jgi:hypothetical protein
LIYAATAVTRAETVPQVQAHTYRGVIIAQYRMLAGKKMSDRFDEFVKKQIELLGDLIDY